jgi:hypothetical protein
MTHVQAIRDVLLAAPAVTALVGSRIYPSAAPQGCARPYIVLSQVSAVPNHTHDGQPDDLLEAARVQVASYGPEYAATHAVAKAVDVVVGALSGPSPSPSAIRDNQRDTYEDATSLHGVLTDYLVQR